MAIGLTTNTNSNTSYLPDWARLLKMHWPRVDWLNEADFGFALRQIEKQTDRNPATPDELLECVEFMAGAESKQKYAPTLREFIINLYVYRKHRDGCGSTTVAGNSFFVEQVKQKIRASVDWRERWNILCQPSLYAGLERDPDYDETLLLDKWAQTVWAEWGDKVFEIKCGMAEGIKQARLSMFSGIRNEARPPKDELRYTQMHSEVVPF